MPPLEDKAKRDLFHGSLEVLVLSVLSEGKQYGYAIQRQVKLASGQDIKAGSLYPLMHRLEEQGLVIASWDESSARKRKWYELTPAGMKRLKTQAADWQAYLARLQSLVLPALRHAARQP